MRGPITLNQVAMVGFDDFPIADMLRPGVTVIAQDGDAFTSGLLGGLARRGVSTPERLRRCPGAVAAEVADEAILIAALTCERSGADPPFAVARPSRRAAAPLTAADLAFAPPERS